MSFQIGLALTLVVMAHTALAGVRELIEQNLKDATTSSQQLLTGSEREGTASRLWIHVRNKNQEKAVIEKREWLQGIELAGKRITLGPVQLVGSGPSDSQLRFFKKRDEDGAKQLLTKLKAVVPRLHLTDLSRQYEALDWIKPGHYELWLAPDVNRLNTP